MPEFLIQFKWEAIVEAEDEEDAEYQYYKGIEENNETINNIAAESVTIKKIKS